MKIIENNEIRHEFKEKSCNLLKYTGLNFRFNEM